MHTVRTMIPYVPTGQVWFRLRLLAWCLLFACCAAGAAGALGVNEQDPVDSTLRSLGFRRTGLPIVARPVELRVMARYDTFHTIDFAGLEQVRRMETETNVRVAWDTVPSEEWGDVLELRFAGDDLPEVLLRPVDRIAQVRYGSRGLLLPLRELVERYAPNLQQLYAQHPGLLERATSPHGALYALPGPAQWEFNVNPDQMLINREWLDRLDLPIPRTMAEFEETLRAFKTQDPSATGRADEIPLSFRWGTRSQGPYSLIGMFGMLDDPGRHLTVRDGHAVFTANTPEHRAALEWFQALYAEGLVDPEAFIQDHHQYAAKGSAHSRRYGVFFDWDGVNVVGAQAIASGEYVAVPPLVGPSGARVWNLDPGATMNHGEAAITSAARHPEIAIRWIDALADPLVNLQWSIGPFGTTLARDGDLIVWADAPAGTGWGEFRHSHSLGRSAPVFWSSMTIRVQPNASIAGKIATLALYEPHFPHEYYPDVFYTVEETDELATLRPTIATLVSRQQAEWIVAGGIAEGWADYQQRLERAGLERYMEIHQAALDRAVR
ncbi:MAG: extracellular solute-binding protein [Spirochaetaceae bacterium]|nr:MAG: extracellular solute-binding protein [Spirochaetaceae bacterium]